MQRVYKYAMLAVFCLSLAYAQSGVAKGDKSRDQNQCCCQEVTCNEASDHPARFVGTYLRTDVTSEGVSTPLFSLNADGTVVGTSGEALLRFVSEGTFGPLFGNWKYIGNHQVLVLQIGWQALDTPRFQEYSALRFTYLIDFSSSLNSPRITARAITVIDPPFPSSALLDPNVGITINDPITPRQLQRVCAFGSDLLRTQ